MNGQPYVFSQHARNDMVCSFAKADLAGLKNLQRATGGELPRTICEKKACVVEAIRANGDAKAQCGF